MFRGAQRIFTVYETKQCTITLFIETCNDHRHFSWTEWNITISVLTTFILICFTASGHFISLPLWRTLFLQFWHILSLYVHLNKLLILGLSYITCNLRKFVVWIKCSCTPKWYFVLGVFIYSVWLFYNNSVHISLYIHITDMALVNDQMHALDANTKKVEFYAVPLRSLRNVLEKTTQSTAFFPVGRLVCFEFLSQNEIFDVLVFRTTLPKR